MNPYRPGFSTIPPVIKNLLLINGMMFAARYLFGLFQGVDLNELLGVYYFGGPQFEPFQLVSHMFMHGNLLHIGFNMLMLWFLGQNLEIYWGPQRFLAYYLATGIGAVILYMGVQHLEVMSLINDLPVESVAEVKNNGRDVFLQGKNYVNAEMAKLNLQYNIPMVGASGAIYGILMAFGLLFPNQEIHLYFLIPIKAKYLVASLGFLELYRGIQNNPADNVAHFAHLGGMLFGYILIRYWNKNRKHFY